MVEKNEQILYKYKEAENFGDPCFHKKYEGLFFIYLFKLHVLKDVAVTSSFWQLTVVY